MDIPVHGLMRYYHSFRSVIPHKEVGFPRVTHPSAMHPCGHIRLACVRHAASVHSEPGSNSHVQYLKLSGPSPRGAEHVLRLVHYWSLSGPKAFPFSLSGCQRRPDDHGLPSRGSAFSFRPPQPRSRRKIRLLRHRLNTRTFFRKVSGLRTARRARIGARRLDPASTVCFRCHRRARAGHKQP